MGQRAFSIAFLMLLSFSFATTAAKKSPKLPRFVSLKSSEVNVRVGPNQSYPIEWKYQRAELPVELIEKYDNWYQLRDWEGSIGWVHRSLLSGRRTVIIQKEGAALTKKPEESSKELAKVSVGVVARVKSCKLTWCRLYFPGAPSVEGWLKKSYVWGVYSDELI